MLTTMKGLVLRERQAGEKGRFLDVLTKEQGVIEVFVRGAKKITGKNMASTQLFAYAAFSMEVKKEQYVLQSASPIRIFYELREDLERLSLATYFSDLIRYAVPKGRQENLVLRLILNTLHYLTEGTRNAQQLKPLFELRFMAELGMMPDVLVCPVCLEYLPERLVFSVADGHFYCADCYTGSWEDGTAISMQFSGLAMIRHIVLMDFARLFHFRAAGETLRQVTVFAERFVCHHLSYRPKSLEFYHSIQTVGVTTETERRRYESTQSDIGTE